MLDSANAVSLTVDGLDYGGWKKVEISAGLERQARDFNLSITWQNVDHLRKEGISNI